MKPVFNFLFFLLFIVISNIAEAQNMAAVNRVLANQNMQFQMQMQMQMNSSMWGYWGKSEFYSRKHTFTVVMADGTTKEVDSKFTRIRLLIKVIFYL